MEIGSVFLFVATGFPLPETHSQLAAENIGALGKYPCLFWDIFIFAESLYVFLLF